MICAYKHETLGKVIEEKKNLALSLEYSLANISQCQHIEEKQEKKITRNDLFMRKERKEKVFFLKKK